MSQKEDPREMQDSPEAQAMAIERRALTGASEHFARLGRGRGELSRRYGIWYVAEHRLLTMRAYLSTIISSSIFNPLMYLFALGVGIGSYIDRNTGTGIVEGVSYLSFVGPALICSAAINAAFDETSFPVMGGFKWTKEFYAMHATSLQPYQIAGGVLVAAGIRVVMTVSIFWIMLSLFGALESGYAVLIIPVAIITGLGIGSVMSAIAASLKEDDGWFALINRMIIAPLFLFSGTFYPLEQMPGSLQWIGWVSPLWHGTELGRILSYGQPESSHMLWVHSGYLMFVLVAGLLFSRRQFTRRLIE